MKNRQNPSGVSLAINKTMASHQKGLPLIEKAKQIEYTIKIANSLEERESAFHLAYRIYLEKGFINKNTNEWLIQPYDFNDDTVILIVQDQQKNTVGSVTLVFDGKSKLPAEKIYSEELQKLRKVGNTFVELSRLVIDPAYRNAKEILVLLFNYSAIYIRQVQKFNSLIIECNPRHKNYYLALMNFDEVGGEKACPQVQNAPAVLLHLSSEKYELGLVSCAEKTIENKKERSLFQYFLKPEQESLVAYYLEKQISPMTAEEKIYFGFSESGLNRAMCVSD